jgi:hypothetical protein
MIGDLIIKYYGENVYNALAFIARFYPIWLPLITGILFWELWVRYVRHLFFSKTEMVLLELRIPKEISKSPLAMEIALLSLNQLGGEGNFVAKYWEGKSRAISSLEIVSLGGEIHFYVWVQKKLRDIVESQYYAQYPNIEISEVPDYTKKFDFVPGKNDMWGCHYLFTKADAYPIKTYVDFGLDRDPKEEFKHDPLTSLLEYLNTMGPDEQIWIQLVVRGHREEKRAGFFSPKTDWKPAAKAEIKNILDNVKKDERQRPTPGELEQIEAIERSLGKFAFDVGIRGIYLAEKKDAYNGVNIGGMRGVFRAFSSNNLNGLTLVKQATDFDFPWQDFKGFRLNRMKRKMLDAYKRRSFFFYPHKHKNLVMTNEELATIFHLPGEVAATPGLSRIPSKRAQAPTNLPT